MKKLSVKTLHFICFIATFLLTSISFYFQYVNNLEPCPLCIMQRLSIILLSLLFLSGVFIHKKSLKIINSCGLILFSGSGLIFSLRQVWLQHLPADQVPSCGPSLNYMLEYMPAQEILKRFFYGTGDCARISWYWLGFSIPEWMVVIFLVFLLISIFIFIRNLRPLGRSRC